MIEGIAYARAGLLGNPSDGYFGKIIGVSVKNFAARVRLEESDDLRIVPMAEEEERYRSAEEFAEKIRLYGYYGGSRLIKAAFKKFLEYCELQGLGLPRRNFTVRYSSTVPRQVGLGGSSAFVTAAMRAFMAHYGIEIPLEIQPSLILSAERDELDINAGFMDRVLQVYEGCLYMDLNEALIKDRGYGIYEKLDPSDLPDLYLAFKPSLGKVSGRVLSEIRRNYDRGDERTISTLKEIASLAEEAKDALRARNGDRFFELMNRNFDLRRKIMTITPPNLEMIEAARRCGASSKFAGSGGSIIGMYRDEEMYTRLFDALGKIGATVIKPIVE